MKLKEQYILYSARENELIAVPTGDETKNFKGLLRANESASFILECLKEETTEEEIVEKMVKEYDASKEELAQDVHEVIEQLRTVKALEE